jgi:hypothetical protein
MHHFIGKSVRFPLCVCPINIVPKFVIHDVNPLPLRVVFPATLPILGMNQVNMAVLVGFASRFPPIQIFIPFNARLLKLVEFTHQRYRAAEV